MGWVGVGWVGLGMVGEVGWVGFDGWGWVGWVGVGWVGLRPSEMGLELDTLFWIASKRETRNTICGVV